MLEPGAKVSTIAKIAERYGVSVFTIHSSWSKHARWPAAVGDGLRNKVYPDVQVDGWVRENRPAVWAAYRQGDQPYSSGGNPEDLLGMREFAQLRADRLGGEPATDDAMYSYIQREVIPKPDRKPGDGLEPEVPGLMWRRASVDRNINEMRGPGNRSSSSRRPAREASQGEDQRQPAATKKAAAKKPGKTVPKK